MATSGLKLLFDENFSHRHVDFVARESRLSNLQHISRMGWSGVEDTVWIPRAIEAGFCIITGDRNERTRGYTVVDLKAMGACVILLSSFFDHLDRWQRAKWLVAQVEKLVVRASDLEPGSVILIDRHLRPQSL